MFYNLPIESVYVKIGYFSVPQNPFRQQVARYIINVARDLRYNGGIVQTQKYNK